MAWTYNSVRIFVTDKVDDIKQTIARLQPLSGKTVHHTFGYESEVVKISCRVVGTADLASLKAMAKTGTSYALVGYGVTYGNFYLATIQITYTTTIYQSLRSDLACDAPVYIVEMELYLDE
jgi:hypothetical protein